MRFQSNGRMFTTKDRDNDEASTNCAVSSHGAWWYGDCHQANLNGDYGNTNAGVGLNWDTWKGLEHSMASTAIMVRKGENNTF